jgi:4-diphosphocytidyl-2-C-methyl-D-erythritol kinase
MLKDSLQAAAWQQLAFRSPAKVNVFFQVKHKRADNYHEIASLYQAISLSDTLYVSLSETDCFTSSDSSLPMDENNLIIRALSLFRKKTNSPYFFKIHLDKKIPMQAGLGGGSSNAATALFAFTKLTGQDITENILASWGSELGSDVPFFFSHGTALATGRGEILEETNPYLSSSFWIIKPKQGLSTPKVYSTLQCDLLPSRGEKDFLYNDLEIPAFALDPSLSALKESLLAFGFASATLCGSGTAFFCLEGKRKYKQSELEERFLGFSVFSVEPLQRKPNRWYE